MPDEMKGCHTGPIECTIPAHTKIKCPKCGAVIFGASSKPLRTLVRYNATLDCLRCGTLYNYLEIAELVGNANKADG